MEMALADLEIVWPTVGSGTAEMTADKLEKKIKLINFMIIKKWS